MKLLFVHVILGLLFMLNGCNASKDIWTLPIHLGDSKSKVYSVLGNPTQDGKENIHWFQDSGFTLWYDPDEKVSSIIIHGPWNDNFRTYQGSAFQDLKVTDTIDKVKKKLGAPQKEEDNFKDSSQATCIWQYPSYVVKVEYWTKDHKEYETPVQSGEICSIEIVRAISGR